MTGAFKVENYLNYILAILAIGLVCIVAIRLFVKGGERKVLLHYERQQRDLVNQQRKGRGTAKSRTAVHASEAAALASLRKRGLERDLQHIRTPWGWPRHQQVNGQDASGTNRGVNGFASRLIREKELSNDRVADPRTSQSVRALLEDRYGRVNRDTRMAEIPYQKVKPPLLRDPSEPHDQMDNFGTLEARQIRRKLERIKSMREAREAASKSKREFRYVALKDMKQPWGW